MHFALADYNTSGAIAANPPLRVYEALPAPIPLGRSLAFVNEVKSTNKTLLLAMLGLLLSGVGIGFLVAALTRPKPGNEAFSLGLVSALFMAIVLFTLDLSFIAIAATHEPSFKTVGLLTHAALGSETQASEAKKQLHRNYPKLEALADTDRANMLAYRVYYDGIYKAPMQILRAMLMSAVLCLVPCVAGTTFASKLIHERSRKWWATCAYVEFMLLVAFLVFYAFRQILFVIGQLHSSTSFAEAWLKPAAITALLAFLAATLYRRKMTWQKRLVLYTLLAVVFVA